jgi:hypothetical protein
MFWAIFWATFSQTHLVTLILNRICLHDSGNIYNEDNEAVQGCQIVYKVSNQKCHFRIFWNAWGCKIFCYFIAILNCITILAVFHGHLVFLCTCW